MSEINLYFHLEPFRKSREDFKREYHTSKKCRYEYLDGWCISGTLIRVKILIRICDCNHTDRRKFVKRTSILFSEIGDGVEAHFDDECHFHLPDTEDSREFRKNCFCGRSFATDIRS